MAGRTLINGTTYEIYGGRTLIDGTDYVIKGGKTLISSTAYDISFGVDLTTLFSGMTALLTSGRNSSRADTEYITPQTSVITKETGYVFSFFDGYISITKYKYINPVSAEIIYQSSATYGNIQLCDWSINKIYYRDAFKVGGMPDGTPVYGATLALIQFDQPENIVDATLSKLQYISSAGTDNANSNGREVYISQNSVSTGDYILVSVADGFAVNLVNTNGELTNVFSRRPSTLTTTNPSLLKQSEGVYFLAYSNNMYDMVNGATIHVLRGG